MSENSFTDLDLFGQPLLSSIKQRSIDSSVSIQQEDISPDNVDFLHAVMCQVGMPRRPIDARKFERRSGLASILIEAGQLWHRDRWVNKPLPTGAKPRIIMIHISSEAVRTDNRQIEILTNILAQLAKNSKEFIDTLNKLRGQKVYIAVGLSSDLDKIITKKEPALSEEYWDVSDPNSPNHYAPEDTSNEAKFKKYEEKKFDKSFLNKAGIKW